MRPRGASRFAVSGMAAPPSVGCLLGPRLGQREESHSLKLRNLVSRVVLYLNRPSMAPRSAGVGSSRMWKPSLLCLAKRVCHDCFDANDLGRHDNEEVDSVYR